jgi:aldehyde:ferredoxin oxidoreductase
MRFLDVDLSRGSINQRTISQSDLRRFLGGSGLGAKLLAEETGPATDPLGPENRLIFAAGPLTGSNVPCSGRHALVAKSPLTSIFAESDVGGRWGTELVKTGWSGLIVKGSSSEPVIISICGDEPEIRPAGHLWGLDSYQTAESLHKELGSKAQAACIGPAGERLVLMASVMHDGRHARAAGRCGLGAVMGSKRLKAVVVSGRARPATAHPEQLRPAIKRLAARIKAAGASLSTCGTAGGIPDLEQSGDLPIKNFRQSSWPAAGKLSGQILAERYLSGRFHCGACPIGCGREISIPDRAYGQVAGAGPEYESAASLGSYCLVDDLEAVCRATELCNRFGMDTISVGAAVAFAMEAYEQGLVSAEDCGGHCLDWGNAAGMLEMVCQIGERRGLGKLLGQGVQQAAERLGQDSSTFALQVKGLELPAHDPRAFVSSGLSYATSNRGACHLAGMTHGLEESLAVPDLGYDRPLDRFTPEGKGLMVARMQDLMGVYDSLKMCKFVLGTVSLADLSECLRLVSGLDLPPEELLLAGERIFNLKRLYNVACGIGRPDDCLPERILRLPRDSGPAAGKLPDLDRMLREYYTIRGWDEHGRPTRDTLHRLNLKSFGHVL